MFIGTLNPTQSITRLKTYEFHKYFLPRTLLPPPGLTPRTIYHPEPYLLSYIDFCFQFFLVFLFFGSVRQIKLTTVCFCAHINMAYRRPIVSYRILSPSISFSENPVFGARFDEAHGGRSPTHGRRKITACDRRRSGVILSSLPYATVAFFRSESRTHTRLGHMRKT